MMMIHVIVPVATRTLMFDGWQETAVGGRVRKKKRMAEKIVVKC